MTTTESKNPTPSNPARPPMAEGKMPEKIWVERVGIGADDIAMLASSLPIRSTLYYRSDSVEGLVKALERAQRLVRLVTVRQAIDSGDDAIEAAGLNPWAMNEGLADGSERIDAHFIDFALSRFRSLQKGEANG